MCGFLGRLNLEDQRACGRVPLSKALLFLQRRGPDSWHNWQSIDTRVELLHTRLAVVDQDDRARQPFTDVIAGLTVVLNGEIYNYQQLRRELADYPFRTTSDTEVLLAILARWGTAGLKRLRGMFACAVVAEETQRVILVRDPTGKKPLYWARWPGGIWFGSSVLALAATCRQPGAVRPELLEDFWRFSYVPPTESLLAGCRPVAPGEVIELDFEGRELARTTCRPDAESLPPRRLEEVQERLAELVRESVARRLHNNPRPVSLLSGGIDSTVVTGGMWQISGGSAITLRGVIPHSLDEKYARYAARRIGSHLDLVSARLQRLEEDVAWALDLQDEPLGMMSFFPLALLIKRAKAYGKILLTGDGADEVFLGYGQPADWSNPACGAGQYQPQHQNVTVGPPLPPWFSPWGRWSAGHSLLGHMFTKLDRASAEQGVEARCPLVDWDLMAFVRSLPAEQLFFTGRPKALLKAQLAGWPVWFVERPKLGFPYRLRWAWGVCRFAGLRDLVTPDSVDTFANHVPRPLRTHPRQWSSLAILRNFPAVWKLLVWSRFTDHLAQATRTAAGTDEEELVGACRRPSMALGLRTGLVGSL
jgi:asparagine synthase (glutamine-hydrolysing)